MTVSVLIVDDSSFFRRRLTEMIDGQPGLKVVGTASNGREGVEKALALKPDVITMDYEMPMLDGISAVREIMAKQPTPILMFSSLTHEGARVTLDALEAGAVDFLPKNFDEISRNAVELRQKLSQRLLDISRARRRPSTPPPLAPVRIPTPAPASASSSVAPMRPAERAPERPALAERAPARTAVKPMKRPALVAIGTSTGGPVALQTVLTQLPANFPVPIVLIQHMPATFTPAFAERLNSVCKIQVKEAVDGDQLRPGLALLAPGGKQLMVVKGGRVKVLPGDERMNYKPSVDITFASAANVFHDQVLAVVLTGMGADGCEGARLLKQQGSTLWSQDEATSVIYGMPMAVAKAGLSDEVLPLSQIGPRLADIH
jgi:two-component system chemotaxis response regulator CheB